MLRLLQELLLIFATMGVIRGLGFYPIFQSKKVQHVLNSYTGDYLLCQTLRAAKDSCKKRLRWVKFTFGSDFSSPKNSTLWTLITENAEC